MVVGGNFYLIHIYNIICMANEIITTKDVEAKVITIRDQRVILDCNVAELYGVETKRINEAVRNNREKFPEGFIIELDNQESEVLRSKISSLEQGKGHYSKFNFKAFTERGLYMLATILKSKQAVQTTIAIINTFVMVREMARTMEALQHESDGGEKQKTLLHRSGELMAEVIGQNLSTKSVETEIELNLAVIKIKHKVTRKEDD